MAHRSGSYLIGRMLPAVLLIALFPSIGGAVDVGDPAPDFTLVDLDGDGYTLSTYSSNPILLMFLACDSGVSNALARPVQNDLYNVFAPRGLRVLGIECMGNDREALNYFRNVTGVGFPLLLDGAQTLADYELEVTSFVIVDGSGTVRYVGRGPTDASYNRIEMGKVIDQILRETAAEKEATWGMIKSLYGG